ALATGLDAAARAGLAGFQPRDLDLGLDPARGFFQRDLQLVLEILAADGAGAAAAASGAPREEGLEDVLAGPAEPAVTATARRPESVVRRALVGIGEHRVRLVDRLEAILGGLVAGIAVGVVLHGELPIRLLDVRVPRSARNAQHLVVVGRHPLRGVFVGGSGD